MVIISFFILLAPAIFISYWVGRGVKLNREHRAVAARARKIDTRGLRPDDVVDLATGEVLSPRERETAIAAGKVRFEI